MEADAGALEVVDFGTVSFGFSQQREIHLKNAGDVGQRFDLRVESVSTKSGHSGTSGGSDALLAASDFTVSPDRLWLGPGERATLALTLLPQHAGGESYTGYRLCVYHPC